MRYSTYDAFWHPVWHFDRKCAGKEYTMDRNGFWDHIRSLPEAERRAFCEDRAQFFALASQVEEYAEWREFFGHLIIRDQEFHPVFFSLEPESEVPQELEEFGFDEKECGSSKYMDTNTAMARIAEAGYRHVGPRSLGEYVKTRPASLHQFSLEAVGVKWYTREPVYGSVHPQVPVVCWRGYAKPEVLVQSFHGQIWPWQRYLVTPSCT